MKKVKNCLKSVVNMMKAKLSKILIAMLVFSCNSEKEAKTSSFAFIEDLNNFYKEVKFTRNGKLIQKIDSLGGVGWNSKTDNFDTTFYINSITLYSDTSKSLVIKYINNQPSAVFYDNLGRKDTLFFDYPLNYNSIVRLNKNLSWSDPVVQNGVDLLMKHCSTCHPFQILSYSTIQKLDTTNISTFRKNIQQIHVNSFADSTVNTISDNELNSIRRIIKSAVREPEVVY